jgi:hypothetical protein
MLTEICLCHACSCHKIENGNGRAGGDEGGEEAAMRLGQTAFLLGSHRLSQSRALLHGHELEAAMGGGDAAGAAEGQEGESFLSVHWVAVPKAVRARRAIRRCRGCGRAAGTRTRACGGAAAL